MNENPEMKITAVGPTFLDIECLECGVRVRGIDAIKHEWRRVKIGNEQFGFQEVESNVPWLVEQVHGGVPYCAGGKDAVPE
jgi:hypothetical protein